MQRLVQPITLPTTQPIRLYATPPIHPIPSPSPCNCKPKSNSTIFPEFIIESHNHINTNTSSSMLVPSHAVPEIANNAKECKCVEYRKCRWVWEREQLHDLTEILGKRDTCRNRGREFGFPSKPRFEEVYVGDMFEDQISDMKHEIV